MSNEARSTDAESQTLDGRTSRTWADDHAGPLRTAVRIPSGRTLKGVEYGPALSVRDTAGARLAWVRAPGGSWWIAAEADGLEEASDGQTVEALRIAEPHGMGAWVTAWHVFVEDSSRYAFDGPLTGSGWLQVDTPEDAQYLGHWLHPDRLRVVAYVEGDLYSYSAADVAGLADLLSELRRIYGAAHIDPGLTAGTRERLEAMGLGPYCWPTPKGA
jgi:hypothetical protein